MQISWLNSYADQPVKTGDKTLGARVVPKKHWDQNCCERLRNCKLYYLSHFLLFDLCTYVNIEIRSRFLFWDLHTWNCDGKYKKRWNILENWQAPDHCVRHCVEARPQLSPIGWEPAGYQLQLQASLVGWACRHTWHNG
jgi:hypothetical protein